ncbi:hypothetical protein HMPREF0156_00133 [Bacteroidetes oral taxon 274 str. F0058]|nr:hypothetical protein HMPREF0156_00133 [Bacteroidetes oral taxon 274 str. F0058]
MKRLIKFSVLVVLITTICISCGSKITEVTVKNKSTDINGYLNGYLEVVDGSYKISMVENNLILNVKLKVVKQLEESELYEISAELLDESDMPLSGLGTFLASYMNFSDDIDKINDALKEGTGEITVKLIYSVGEDNSKESEALKIASEKAKSFSINSKIKDDVTISENNGNKNWEKILTDYESYTNQCIKLLKKANSGDVSAMTEYLEVLQKAQDIQESFLEAEDDITTAQMERFVKIQKKLIDATSDM